MKTIENLTEEELRLLDFLKRNTISDISLYLKSFTGLYLHFISEEGYDLKSFKVFEDFLKYYYENHIQ